MGYSVSIFETQDKLGGMMNLIPDHRLNKGVVQSDIEFLLTLGDIRVNTGSNIEDPKHLLTQGYDAVCVTVGLWKPIELDIPNADLAIKMVDLLSHPESFDFDGRVAVIGGGATAVDCAVTAKDRGAKHVELFMLEKLSEMPLTPVERQELIDFDVEVSSRIRISGIQKKGRSITGSRQKRLLCRRGCHSARRMYMIWRNRGEKDGYQCSCDGDRHAANNYPGTCPRSLLCW